MLSQSPKLQRAMEMASDKPHGDVIHGQIYSYTEKCMDPEAIPHIHDVIYATRRIIRPHMLWEHTQDLLELFAHAEAIRRQIIIDAKEAMVWDQFYHMGTHDMVDGRRLDERDRKILKGMLKNDGTLRETYRTVVLHVCWAHLHYVRRSGQTVPTLIRLFRQYFPDPSIIKSKSAHQPLASWMSDMSQNEIPVYDVLREKVTDFLVDAEQWEAQYLKGQSKQMQGSIRSTLEFQDAFSKRFPLLVEWETLINILDRHLGKIQTMVEKLNNIFP
ncbi:hypothetical protein BU17DRAFT_83530 [Hysterangium stoloniferum]|nr:hypothetical protein BU17DRAFT_83530 [Hysterangium stoloniferum]